MEEKKVLARERAEHDELYANIPSRWLKVPLTWDRYRSVTCVPPHEGGPLYGFDIQLFVDRVESILRRLPSSASVLDFGCGRAEMGVLVARRGFRVSGFDISAVSIHQARRIAAVGAVDDHTKFVVGNAQQIPFPSGSFDLVLGKAVLHHVIKYDGTSTELARVMKPGARALFLEGAAANPLIRLARRFTIKEELGDVPLTRKRLEEWFAPFSEADITGYLLFYMLKRLGFRGYKEDDWRRGRNWLGRTRIFERFLELCFEFDKRIVNERSWADRVAGRYMIELRR